MSFSGGGLTPATMDLLTITVINNLSPNLRRIEDSPYGPILWGSFWYTKFLVIIPRKKSFRILSGWEVCGMPRSLFL